MKKHQTRTANNGLFAATHGESKTKLYKVWAAMKDRCSNPASTTYKRYGGRGIKVCKQWQDSYKSFRDWAIDNGYSEGLTIERIDNDGNYSPENCRCATRKEQSNNMSRNRLITYNGKTKTAVQWSELIGVNAKTISTRLRRGWSETEALFGRSAGEISFRQNDEEAER